MVRVAYKGVDDLAADDDLFADSHRLLKEASRAVRSAVYRELLDHMRKWMAISSQVLDAAVLEQLVARSHSRLRPPWGFGSDEKPRGARWLMVVAPLAGEALSAMRTSSCAAVHEAVSGERCERRSSGAAGPSVSSSRRTSTTWSTTCSAQRQCTVSCRRSALRSTSLAGASTTRASSSSRPARRRRAAVRGGTRSSGTSTRTSLGCSRAPVHPLFGFEAREHTAQVDPDNREIREKRFRFGERERKELESGRAAAARGRRGQSVPPGSLLLADDGARRRHLHPERGPHAQRAAHAGELRAARRARGPRRAGRPGGHLRVFAEPARPVLLSRPEGDGLRRGAGARPRAREPGTCSTAISRRSGSRASISRSIRVSRSCSFSMTANVRSCRTSRPR